MRSIKERERELELDEVVLSLTASSKCHGQGIAVDCRLDTRLQIVIHRNQARSLSIEQTNMARARAGLVLPRALSPHRYSTHYDRVLAHDLLYMTYDHSLTQQPELTQAKEAPKWDPSNPYTRNRPARRPKGNSARTTPGMRAIGPHNVVRLEEIVLNCFVKEASSSKSQILPALAGFQAMTGEPLPGFASDAASSSSSSSAGSSGIQVVYTKKGSASFKVRAGQVCGAKVSLKGESMWTFLETLVDLVLPRLKDWNGIKLPPPSVNLRSPASTSGVVSIGLPPSAMGLFPGVEVNLEQYPRLQGFHVQFLTNAKGKTAQDQARALLSGFRLPL